MTLLLKNVPVYKELFVMNLFKNKKNGLFVEVGTKYDLAESGTLLLEKCLNWKGICVEKNEQRFINLEIWRKCMLVNEHVGANNIPHFGKGLIAPTCGTSTLNKILTERHMNKHIDFLNINVTYADEILAGINFKKYSFGCISLHYSNVFKNEQYVLMNDRSGLEYYQYVHKNFLHLLDN